MGQPATPTPADRAATRALAQAVVKAVTEDERMPLPIEVCRDHVYRAEDVESLVMSMAQEIAALADELVQSVKFNADLAKDVGELESGRMWHEAATERERIRSLLAEACDSLEFEGLEETAQRLRQQGGAWER